MKIIAIVCGAAPAIQTDSRRHCIEQSTLHKSAVCCLKLSAVKKISLIPQH